MQPSTVLMIAGALVLALAFGFLLRPDLIGPFVRRNIGSVCLAIAAALLMERLVGPLAAVLLLWIMARSAAGWLKPIDPPRPLGR